MNGPTKVTTDVPAAELVDRFISDLGMPRSLAAVGVHADKMAKIAEYTMDDIWGKTNPRPISGPADVMEILELAK